MLATASGWEVEVERGPGWLLVKVGDPGCPGEELPSLAESVWSVLDQHFTYRLVLELNQIPLLNSYLIGQLIELYRRIQEHDGVLRLCGLSAYNRHVLRTCRLEERLPAFRDRREAVLSSSARPSQPR
jgi:anti-anti-sigma regulatory factor